jgi:putative mycofactocin binding protein MftB
MRAESVLDRAWDIAPQVSVRPEPFGALLYHFGTRQLSLVKDRSLLAAIEGLSDASSARAACTAVGIDEVLLPRYARALARLIATDVLRERPR